MMRRNTTRNAWGVVVPALLMIALAAPTAWAQAWSDATPLNSNAAGDVGDDFSVVLACDGAGTWVAAWWSNDDFGGTIGTDRDILVARSVDDGATWNAAMPLNTNAATDTGDDDGPEVATDGAGNWIVAWDSYDTLGGTIGTDADILVSRSMDNGATWTDPAPLNNGAGTDGAADYNPALAADGTSNWLAVWYSSNDLGGTIGTDHDILFAHSSDGGVTWSDPAPVNMNAATDLEDDVLPRVVTDGAGTWMVVWASWDDLGGTIGPDSDILGATSTDSGMNWTTPLPIHSNAASDIGDDQIPALTTDRAGTWLAAWQSREDLDGVIGTDPDILVVQTTDGGATWTDPMPLNNNADTDSAFDGPVHLRTDELGYWMAIWDSSEILMAVSADGGAAWTAPAILNSNAGSGSNLGSQFATDGNGNWVAAWHSEDDLGGTIGGDVDILTARAIFPGDCNGNWILDSIDLAECTGTDCNGNEILDECEIAADPNLDANYDGILDACAVFADYVWINPRSTYLRTNADPGAIDAQPIDLQALGILPGYFIKLERLGDFGSTTGRDDGEYNEDMVVVFSASDTLLAPDQLVRVPDAVVAGGVYSTPNTLIGDLPTDIAEDFYVYIEALCVPTEARYLFVSGVDSFFGDNFDANHDFALRITSTPGFIDCNHNGVPDDDDVASGVSSDFNANGIPDECETVAFDAIAVEFVVHNDLSSSQLGSDAVAVELTVFNDPFLDTGYSDAIAVEFTLHNDLSSAQVGNDAVAVEFTVWAGPWPCAGDLDMDGDTDIDDFAIFAGCMDGPGQPLAPGCEETDFDGDGDVDMADFAAFQIGFGCP